MTKQFAPAPNRIEVSTAGLKVHAYRMRDAAIVVVEEPTLSRKQDVDIFAAQVEEVAAQMEKPIIVIDCLNIESVSSQMLGQLVSLHRAMEKRGGQLRLAGLNDEIRRLLSTTRLDRQLRVFNDLAGAVKGGRRRWWWPFGQ